jgi:hypothetical protein
LLAFAEVDVHPLLSMNSMPGEDDSSSPYLFSTLIFCGHGLFLIDELDAGQLKYPSEHSDRLRPHAKPVSYRFLGVFTA